jgi:hypothetical protein
MGLTKNITYEQIVGQFSTACKDHLQIASFETGTIDFLDASAVNRLFPYVFLRPLTTLYQDRQTTRTFELYTLDQPKVKTQDNVQVMSNCEIYGYDLLSWFDFGPAVRQQNFEVTMTSGIPVNEAFQDRLYGWMFTVNVVTPWILDYCNYPQI